MKQTDIDLLQTSPLSRDTPFVIQNVSLGMFSIARYYGSATFNGSFYIYNGGTDELVRDDVLKWLAENRKSKHEAVHH